MHRCSFFLVLFTEFVAMKIEETMFFSSARMFLLVIDELHSGQKFQNCLQKSNFFLPLLILSFVFEIPTFQLGTPILFQFIFNRDFRFLKIGPQSPSFYEI